jgi:uncharacterized protein
MSEQQNVDIVKGSYEAFGRGDLDGLIAALADDIQWTSPGPSDLPTAGLRVGHDQVRQFFGTIMELYEFLGFEPQRFIAQGDTVVVTGVDRIRVKATGNVVEETWAHVFTIANGKIATFQEYIDTATVVAELRSAIAKA